MVIFIRDQFPTFSHMGSRELRKTQYFLSYKQNSLEKLQKANTHENKYHFQSNR